jgi:hypothetical protein
MFLWILLSLQWMLLPFRLSAYHIKVSQLWTLLPEPSIIDTVPVPANRSIVFRPDSETGELKTTSSMAGFVDGFFELQVTTNNTEVAGREVNTTVKVWNIIILYLLLKQGTNMKRSLVTDCFIVVSCLAYSFALKMEALCSSETPVDLHQTMQYYSPEQSSNLLVALRAQSCVVSGPMNTFVY